MPGTRLVEGSEPETTHPGEVPVQRPDSTVPLSGDRGDKQVADAESVARGARHVKPSINEIPGAFRRVKQGQSREGRPQACAIASGCARKNLDAHRYGKPDLVLVQQAPQVARLSALGPPECRNPHRCVDHDHRRGRRGRRREDARSTSSLTRPIISFSSSIRLRRMSSRSDRTTVSVLDVNPRSLRASSMRGSGIFNVVRISSMFNYMR